MATLVKLRKPSVFRAGYGRAPMCAQSAKLMLLFLGCVLTVPGLAEKTARKPPFHAAEIVSATEVVYPITATAWGTLVFDVGISATGEVEDVKVRRGLEPFTAEAVRAIENWEFRPAMFTDRPVASIVTVAVTFNPRMLSPVDAPLAPVESRTGEEKAKPNFRPAEVESAAYPAYPPGAVNPGTVVLEAALSEKGEVERTKVIRDFAPFTESAVQSLERWKFNPAKLNGKSVSSRMVLAFVFQTIPTPLPHQ